MRLLTPLRLLNQDEEKELIDSEIAKEEEDMPDEGEEE